MEGELLSVKEKDTEETEKQKEYNQVEELRYSIAALLAENDVFERFLGRMDLQDLDLQDLDLQDLGLQGEGESPNTAEDSQLAEGGVETRQNICSNLSDHFQLLTLEQKLYVVKKEITDTQEEQKQLQLKYKKILDNYKASIKEAELHLAEIRRAKKEFECKQLQFMKDRRLEMKEPEKVLQYIEDRSKATQLEKFTRKNQILKVQEKMLLRQLQQKKLLGKELLETISLDYEEPKDGKSFNELQRSRFEVQRTLSLHKEKLQSVTLDSTELSNKIIKRNQMRAKIDEKIQRAEKDCLKAESLNQRLCKELTDYQAPDITEYMNAKDKQKKLQHSVHTWERKVGIAEMAMKMNTRERSKHKVTPPPANSTESGSRCAKGQIPMKLPHIAENHA